jgi:hypothetical protein
VKITCRKVIILGFLLLISTQVSLAQDIELGKTNLRAGEEFSIAIVFPKENKKEFKAFPFPEIQDFIKVQTHIEEDKKAKIYKVIQTYRPLKAGKFKMQAFKIIVGDKTISSSGATINVLGVSSKQLKLKPEFQNAQFKSEKEEFFLKVSTDKNAVFAGEGLMLTASLLIGENNKTGFNFFDLNDQLLKVARNLSANNCMIDDNSRGMIEQLKFDSIKIGNKIYKRIKIFEAKVYPINSTDIKFPSIEFKLLKYLTARVQNDILWKAEELSLKSQPLRIKVKELPDHPLKEKVTVGSFQIKEGVSFNKIKTGQSFKYSITVTGNGNISAILAPEINENDNLAFFTPEIKQYYFTKEGILLGQKIFTYNIIPKEPGQYNMGDYFEWVYFNPFKNNYDTLKSQMHVTVTGESQKNREISSTDLGSFYELAGKESNKLRSKEKDQSIKFFANILILFMLVTTAILIFRR